MLRIVAHSKAPEYSFICQVLPSAKPRWCFLALTQPMTNKSASPGALETSGIASLYRRQIAQRNSKNHVAK